MTVDQIVNQIKALDVQIVADIDARSRLAKQFTTMTDAFSTHGIDAIDAEILQYLTSLPTRDTETFDLLSIYREIQSVFRSIADPSPVSIACMGPVASFSHLAAHTLYKRHCEYDLCDDVHQIFDLVDKCAIRFGIIAVENAVHGHIGENLDLLAQYRIPICREIAIQIKYSLLISGDIAQVQRIHASEEAAAQCRRSIDRLRERFGKIQAVQVVPEAEISAAARFAHKDPTVAVIASQLAGEFWQLRAVEDHFEDDSRNMTRFVVIGHESPEPTSKDRTSIWVAINHTSGALVRILQPLVNHKINITGLALRPARPAINQPWAYSAFVEFEGHAASPEVHAAIDEMATACGGERPRVLGAYPQEVNM